MPKGVEVVVDDGFATIDFVDRALRGPGLAKLLEIGGPETIEIDTRTGPRKLYRVPEGNAREAGLLDEAEAPKFANGGVITPGSTPGGDSVPVVLEPATQAWPEGDPSHEWKLAQLQAFAARQGKDASDLRSKAEVLALINAGEQP